MSLLQKSSLYAAAKSLLYEVIYFSGAVGVFRYIHRNSVAVLTYHDVLPPGYPRDNPLYGMAVDTAEFAWQLDYIRRYYNPVSLQQFSDWYYERAPLPRNSVLVTFDDGHSNNLSRALPLLRERGIPAVCFALARDSRKHSPTWYEDAYLRVMHSPVRCYRTTGGDLWLLENDRQRAAACGRLFGLFRTLSEAEQERELRNLQDQLTAPVDGWRFSEDFRYLNADGFRLLEECKVEIGGHSITHPILSTLSSERAEHEIAGCKNCLEEMLGSPVRAFAYPFGAPDLDFTRRECELLRKFGYRFGFASVGGFATREDNAFALPRLGVGQMSRACFAATISGALQGIKMVLHWDA